MAAMTARCGRCGREQYVEEAGEFRPSIGGGKLGGWATLTLTVKPQQNCSLCPWCVVVVQRVLAMATAHPSEGPQASEVTELPLAAPPHEVVQQQQA